MSHSYAADTWELLPGVILEQWVCGGVTEPEGDCKGKLTESISYKLFDGKEGWPFGRPVEQDKAVGMLLHAGYKVSYGTAGLLQHRSLVAEK